MILHFFPALIDSLRVSHSSVAALTLLSAERDPRVATAPNSGPTVVVAAAECATDGLNGFSKQSLKAACNFEPMTVRVSLPVELTVVHPSDAILIPEISGLLIGGLGLLLLLKRRR